jgi:hypothetical protein
LLGRAAEFRAPSLQFLGLEDVDADRIPLPVFAKVTCHSPPLSTCPTMHNQSHAAAEWRKIDVRNVPKITFGKE